MLQMCIMIQNHRKLRRKIHRLFLCASQEIDKKLIQPEEVTSDNILISIFWGCYNFHIQVQTCKTTCVLTGDVQGLDDEMLSGLANLTLITRKILVFLFFPGPTEFFQTPVLLLFVFNVKQFKDNTYIRYHCDKCMCYKKWQCLRGSIFKTILHEGKAIFSTKQTNITKQVQWYFYILEILKKNNKNLNNQNQIHSDIQEIQKLHQDNTNLYRGANMAILSIQEM